MNKKLFLVAPFVLVSLIVAIWTGLLRMGWELPVSESVVHHGALMVGSFLGTVIILERVVALKNKWLYIIPVISGLSGVLFLFGQSKPALIALCLASAGLILLYFIIISRYKHYYFYVMLLGAVCWMIGNIFILKGTMYAISVPWWMAFILFTIMGERLELSKFLPPRKLKYPLLWIALAVVMIGLFLPYHGIGSTTTGVGFAGTAIWLFSYDIIRKSIKAKGLHKFNAVMLGMGYIWLLITGVFFITGNQMAAMYDAAIHAFFIGFTFSMIFAHGPIIFPGVAGLPFKPFHPFLYLLGYLLQLSLILRVLGDYLLIPSWKMTGGLVNAFTILLFFITLIILIKIEKSKYSTSKK